MTTKAKICRFAENAWSERITGIPWEWFSDGMFGPKIGQRVGNRVVVAIETTADSNGHCDMKIIYDHKGKDIIMSEINVYGVLGLRVDIRYLQHLYRPTVRGKRECCPTCGCTNDWYIRKLSLKTLCGYTCITPRRESYVYIALKHVDLGNVIGGPAVAAKIRGWGADCDKYQYSFREFQERMTAILDIWDESNFGFWVIIDRVIED